MPILDLNKGGLFLKFYLIFKGHVSITKFDILIFCNIYIFKWILEICIKK